MKKVAIIFCAAVIILIAVGTIQEKAEAKADMNIAETSIEIQKTLPEVISESKPISPYSEKDLELLALVTVAEAEGESELGKRLVIDTVLNRMDSPYFPDTIADVIWQKSQFESMWNGRKDRCVITDHVRKLVREETQNRTNNQVVFFRTLHYSKYGSPLFQEGNHYFSSL